MTSSQLSLVLLVVQLHTVAPVIWLPIGLNGTETIHSCLGGTQPVVQSLSA